MPLPEKKERNKKIYNEKKTGTTYRSLSAKYGLAIQVIQRIINREKTREG